MLDIFAVAGKDSLPDAALHGVRRTKLPEQSACGSKIVLVVFAENDVVDKIQAKDPVFSRAGRAVILALLAPSCTQVPQEQCVKKLKDSWRNQQKGQEYYEFHFLVN